MEVTSEKIGPYAGNYLNRIIQKNKIETKITKIN